MCYGDYQLCRKTGKHLVTVKKFQLATYIVCSIGVLSVLRFNEACHLALWSSCIDYITTVTLTHAYTHATWGHRLSISRFQYVTYAVLFTLLLSHLHLFIVMWASNVTMEYIVFRNVPCYSMEDHYCYSMDEHNATVTISQTLSSCMVQERHTHARTHAHAHISSLVLILAHQHVHPPGNGTLSNQWEALNFDQVGHTTGGGPRTIVWSWAPQLGPLNTCCVCIAWNVCMCNPFVGLQSQLQGTLALPDLHHKARARAAAISYTTNSCSALPGSPCGSWQHTHTHTTLYHCHKMIMWPFLWREQIRKGQKHTYSDMQNQLADL